MGVGEVPVVLARGLHALLRDAHRHALFGLVLFLPLAGFAYLLAPIILELYRRDPVLIIVVASGMAGIPLGLWVGAIAKGIDARLHGDVPKIDDLIDAMLTRSSTRAVLGLLCIVLALGMFAVMYVCVESFGWPMTLFAVRSALLLSVAVFAATSCVVVLERAGPWRAVLRCFALARGRRWFAVLSLIVAALLANGFYTGLQLACFASACTVIAGWPKLVITLFVAAVTAALAAAMGAAVIHHLRALEERRSPAALADHFD